MEISAGIKVSARGLQWDVTEVEQLGGQQRLHLTCIGGDLVGLEWDMLYPAEAVTVLRTDPGPEDAGTLDAWRRYHIAWLLDQVPGVPTPPGRVAIEAYQRVPLLRALDMVRPRLLLADGVGLGKTIQAGLIAAELIVRRRAHRILVVSPPGPLLRQWEQEMRLRFGLRFTPIIDSASLRGVRRGMELGGNPFDATALCLTSIDFCKQDRVLEELERTAWDLVIIDEAHHCVAAPGSRDANQRRRLAEVLARHGDGLLLLTATPHDGNDAHFASLIALLDPSLVDAAGRLIGSAYRRHVIRRLKSHIRDPRTGMALFHERTIIPVRVDVTAPEAEPVRQFHQALSALVAPRLRRSRDRTGLPDALAFVSLLKRSMSSIAACLATLRVVAARYADADQPATDGAASDTVALRRERQRALRAYRRRGIQFGVLDAAEEEEIASLEAEEIAANLAGTETTADLLALIRLGEAAALHDPKLAALVLEIRLIRLAYPGANILVYTEYADSQQAALDAMSAAGFGGTILTISGADPESVRTRSAERCAEEDGIILVSTDSLAEGLNLHQRCFHLIHLDLPYNPNRLEQRNGRIDRYGQRNDPQIRYLYLAGTFEERLLLRLIAKYEKARACLVFMPNTLGLSAADPDDLREPLFTGFAEDPPTLFGKASRLIHSLDLAAEDNDGEAYRDLLREIDRAFKSFDHMAVRHGWMTGAVATDPPVELAQAAIDLPAFVASTLSASPDGYRVPVEWTEKLEGLAGFDQARGTVRLTDDPDRWRNADGQEVMYPGRSHPLTRHAIALARTAGTGRVSVARGHRLSLVITYLAEVGGRSDTLFRQSFALRLFPTGSIREQTDFLSLSEPIGVRDDAQPNDGLAHEVLAESNLAAQRLWRSLFAGWALDRIAEAGRLAAVTAASLAEGFAAAHLQRVDRDAAVATAWLNQRTLELCGAIVPWIGDLFDVEPPVSHWRSNPAAEQRLAGFAIDPSVPVSHRRDAEGTLTRFRAIIAARPEWSPPVTRILGMLMLCP
jgi:SNF2-related domain/Helicase conserved C-terminal domain